MQSVGVTKLTKTSFLSKIRTVWICDNYYLLGVVFSRIIWRIRYFQKISFGITHHYLCSSIQRILDQDWYSFFYAHLYRFADTTLRPIGNDYIRILPVRRLVDKICEFFEGLQQRRIALTREVLERCCQLTTLQSEARTVLQDNIDGFEREWSIVRHSFSQRYRFFRRIKELFCCKEGSLKIRRIQNILYYKIRRNIYWK